MEIQGWGTGLEVVATSCLGIHLHGGIPDAEGVDSAVPIEGFGGAGLNAT